MCTGALLVCVLLLVVLHFTHSVAQQHLNKGPVLHLVLRCVLCQVDSVKYKCK